MFRPLLSSPKVLLDKEEDELDLSGIENLSSKVIDQIQMKAREKEALNGEHANRAIKTGDGILRHMYCALANFANITSDNVWIFMRLYAVSDFNQRRLVKQKMATILSPVCHRALTSYTVDSSLGIFGGEEHVMMALEYTKK